jgi:hypothetical protein
MRCEYERVLWAVSKMHALVDGSLGWASWRCFVAARQHMPPMLETCKPCSVVMMCQKYSPCDGSALGDGVGVSPLAVSSTVIRGGGSDLDLRIDDIPLIL